MTESNDDKVLVSVLPYRDVGLGCCRSVGAVAGLDVGGVLLEVAVVDHVLVVCT